MDIPEIVIGGTLKPDGALELDQKPNLAPGRVTVVLRQEAAAPQEDWWQCLQRLRAERKAAGYPFMTEEETNAHIAWLREGDRFDDMLAEVAEQPRQKPEQP